MSGVAHPPAARVTVTERVERLGRFAGRRAYLWRDGVRWRSRTYGEVRGRAYAAAAALRAAGLAPGEPILVQGTDHPKTIEEFLGLPVRIAADTDPRSGAVTIRYRTLDQLDLICQRLTGGGI